MKNKLMKYSLVLVSAVLLLASCDKDSEGLSKVTYYCDLTLKGSATELVSIGGTYSDPGWEALENGEDISGNVEVSGTVKMNEAGLYKLTYKINNSDGYPTTATRQVVVCDVTSSPIASGVYTVSTTSRRTPGSSAEYANGNSLLIYQVSPGKFYISDFIGGYYDKGRGYGSDYACPGHFTLESDNSITLVDGAMTDGFGGDVDSLVGSYDAATNTLTFDSEWSGYIFTIIATKKL